MFLTAWLKHKKIKVLWSISWRNWALIPIGYGMGEGIKAETYQSIIAQIPAIFISTCIVIIVSMLYAYYISSKTDINFSSSLIGNMPGGMMQMILIAEEIPGTDHNIVIVMQNIRLLMSIIFVPFLVIHSIDNQSSIPAMQHTDTILTQMASFSSIEYAFVVFIVILSVFIANKIHFPSAYLLGPLFAIVLMNIFWRQVPHIDGSVIRFAQFFIGVQMGANIEMDRMKALKKSLLLIVSSSAILIVICFLLSKWLYLTYNYSPSTAFLATAPGGVTEMSITALSIGADVATVLSYQLFRMIFLSTIVPVLLRSYFTKKT